MIWSLGIVIIELMEGEPFGEDRFSGRAQLRLERMFTHDRMTGRVIVVTDTIGTDMYSPYVTPRLNTCMVRASPMIQDFLSRNYSLFSAAAHPACAYLHVIVFV